MSSGVIKVAEHEGISVIRMEGDVRLTLCLSFDNFIENMLTQPDFRSVLFDLSGAQAIDSTTLGLMAKIAIRSRALGHDDPVVITENPNMTRLLVSMGFEDIFNLIGDSKLEASGASQAALSAAEGQALTESVQDEKAVQESVLEAHQVLMSMNKTNHDTFRELVETLESQR